MVASLSRRPVLGLLAGCLVLAPGCRVGPTYRTPEVEVPASWSIAGEAADRVQDWWKVFDDPQLFSLIDRAVAANLDLRAAEARIREARALGRIAGAGPWPTVNTTAGYSHSERSESANDNNDDAGVGGGAGSSGGGAGGGREGDLFRAGVDALWEIDLFGGLARSIEAADANSEAAVESHRAALVRLVGDVAVTYVELRGLQAELGSTRSNLDAQSETLELTGARHDVGLASDFDVERARAQVATTAAEIPVLEASRRVAVHRLGILLGEHPTELVDELSSGTPIPRAPATVAIGVPADLLRRRPDVRATERALAAATARIGEAEADLYPRLTLTGSVGLRSQQIQDLVSGKSLSSTFGPNLVWPIFDAGRIRGNVAVQDARREQALVAYESAVRRALEEVENAYARWDQERARRRALDQAVKANRVAAELAGELYANGLVDFLEVLDAERSRFESERLLVRSDAAIATHLTALYVALGGGWDVTAKGAGGG